ncbi:helix-turn-helix domain-containing protein [Sinomonas gamaensis]|uniref:helix-turn-helix domain-containing protein n=1 Tax=Sinomonas gamaensis TaxID=2565624 RepID=UPI001BB151D1|nr:helix-turn-helix domain-containing protein [Sinomonas gamaensis]
MTIEPAYVSRKEAAVYLGVTVRWLANEGRRVVPAHRFGGQIRYALEELKAWAKQQRVCFA